MENTIVDTSLASIHDVSISLHAMVGTPSSKIMRIRGMVNKKHVIVLIDTRSTHNFLDVDLI